MGARTESISYIVWMIFHASHKIQRLWWTIFPAKPTLRRGCAKQSWFLCEYQSQEVCGQSMQQATQQSEKDNVARPWLRWNTVTGIERELEEIGERLSKKMLTTMRDGDATLIDTTRIWIPSVQSIPGFDWGITSDLWFWSMSLWTLQCCRVSSLHWEGDLWTGLSISLPTWNGTIGWAWSLMMRSQVWHASAYVTGMIAALVCAKLCCQVLRLMSGVIANDGLLCWHKLCWLICCKGCLKADFWITCWIGGTHGCQGCSERIEWLYGL